MKRAKNDNHTNKPVNVSKKKTAKGPILVLSEYIDCNVQRKKPMTHNGLERLMLALYSAIKKDESVSSLTIVLTELGIPRSTYYAWVDDFPFVKEAHDTILTILADRNTKRFINDFRYVNIVQPMLDPYVYRKGLEFHAQLRKLEQEKPTQTIVVMEKMPSTDIKNSH